MGTNLMMSLKERDHLSAIKEVIKGHLSASEAGKLLGLSRRHVFRLLKRYRAAGDTGLVHRLRGGASNRGYPTRLKTRVLELYWRSEYRDYGPTLFAEELLKEHKILVDHETVRRWLMAKGGTNVQRRKRPHRAITPSRIVRSGSSVVKREMKSVTLFVGTEQKYRFHLEGAARCTPMEL